MRPNEMKYIQRSLSPHTRMPLGQHNPLQALGFLLLKVGGLSEET
jgi:hypothetical protein